MSVLKTGKKILPPLLFLVIVAAAFVYYSYGYYRFPVIDSIEPDVAYPGEWITINGRCFGDERNGSEVRIAGSRPRSDTYSQWTDERIVVRIPEDAGSGMVAVKTRRGTSNQILFANKEHIPVIFSGPQKPGYPYMETAEPVSASVGDLVTISGLNFGHERGNSSVFFTAAGIGDEIAGDDENLSGMIRCSEIDYDYESWDDQQIKVYIPDGATSGNIRIKTDKGLSNALFFEVSAPAGTKSFTGKMGFQIEYGVDIAGATGDSVNSLDVWVPAVRSALVQRNVETVADPAPLWDDYMGMMRYHFENIGPGQNRSISVKSWFECYGTETRVVPAKIDASYNTDRKLYKVYTQAESRIPSEDARIASASRKAVGRIRNPYQKAEAVYRYLLDNLEYSSGLPEDPSANLEKGAGDSYTYSMLFTAMCRAAGVPARPVAGALVYNNKQSVNHYWAEFYIEGFGWLPVDAAVGDGARFGNFPQNEEIDVSSYYFGNIDNQHISLTRGIIPVKAILPGGRVSGRKGNYSLQTIYEESSGLAGYSSYWRPVRIVDWW